MDPAPRPGRRRTQVLAQPRTRGVQGIGHDISGRRRGARSAVAPPGRRAALGSPDEHGRQVLGIVGSDIVAGLRPEIVVEDQALQGELEDQVRGAPDRGGVAAAIPAGDRVEHRSAVRGDGGGAQIEQTGCHAGGPAQQRVALDGRHGVQRDAGACGVEQLGDAGGAVAAIELHAQEHVAAVDPVVGGDDPAGRGIEHGREVVERHEALPIVLSVPARDRAQALVGGIGADRDRARQLVADVTVGIGIDEVLRRGAEQAQGVPERGPVVGAVDGEECLEHAVGHGERRPAQRVQRGGAPEPAVRVVEDRAVRGLPDREVHVVAPGHLDRLGADGERLGAFRGQVPGRVRGIDLLLHQVLDVRPGVGDAPRDAGVVPGDHAGRAGEGDAGHVVRAGGADGTAVEAVHVPHGRHVEAKMRVVRQECGPGRGSRRPDDPVVGADAAVVDEIARRCEATEGRDRVRDAGDREPGIGVGRQRSTRAGARRGGCRDG